MIMAKKEKQMPHTVFLGLGSNLGDRENYLISACRAITDMEGFETIACGDNRYGRFRDDRLFTCIYQPGGRDG